jgi:hypothetical protein
MATAKALYIDSNGVYRPFNPGDVLQTGAIQLTDAVVSDGVLSTDASGNVSSALLVNANIDAAAAIEGSKIDPDFGSQSIYGNGANITDLDADNINAGTLADARLSANVALYDAAAPSFTNKLGVGSVTDADTTKAATVQYVLNKVNAAIAGLDYKQAAQFVVENATGFTLAQILTAINGTSSVFAAGDRVLVNWPAGDIDTGIYVLSGSDSTWTWARSADMAVGSDASGDYVYAYLGFNPSTGGTGPAEAALVCQQLKGSIVGTAALSFSLYGQGISYNFTAPLSESGGDVSLSIDSTTLELNGSQELAVGGVPAQFKIDGTAVSVTVDAASLDTLTAGAFIPAADADALHFHKTTDVVLGNTGPQLDSGKACWFDGATVSYASKADGKCIGVINNDNNDGNVFVSVAGNVGISAPSGSPSGGESLYVGISGVMTTYAGLSSGDFATKVGRYTGDGSSNHSIAIAIQEFGVKP